jgi:hypothetical protein
MEDALDTPSSLLNTGMRCFAARFPTPTLAPTSTAFQAAS